MRSRTRHPMHHAPIHDPEEPDDDAPLPVDADEGLVHAIIPDDPEFDRVVEPLD